MAVFLQRLAALSCLRREGNDVIFEGCNIHIRSGAGATHAAVNGLGNLIIGYNEGEPEYLRTGSHNLVVGKDHSYSSFTGIVAGENNTISGGGASAIGGFGNVVNGFGATITGGADNIASGQFSSISGGQFNTTSASAGRASVSGGHNNTASNVWASVSGGNGNTASGLSSSVSGGLMRLAPGDNNWAGGMLLQPFSAIGASPPCGVPRFSTSGGTPV
jgi:hypothetical protein